MRLEPNSERRKIDAILAAQVLTVWDRLAAEISGIEIVERRNPITETQYEKDCASYIQEKLGLDPRELLMITHMGQPIKGYRETSRLERDALVAYYSPSDDLRQRHFGIGESDESVLSKWNVGHVFRHPVGLVEGMYTQVRFFKK